MRKTIPESKRSDWAVKKFGFGEINTSLLFENVFFKVLRESSRDYLGGYFDFVEESDGTPWMQFSERKTKFNVIGKENWYEGTMSGEALSLGAMIIAANRLCWHFFEQGNHALSEKFGDLYYSLKDVAAKHKEAKDIYCFID